MPETRLTLLLAILGALLSGALAAVTLEPAIGLVEALGFTEDLLGFLGPFAITAGLMFGVVGVAITTLRLGARPLAGVAFLSASMAGIAAAVYVALLVYDNTTESFVAPYGAGSPIGAVILAIPAVFLTRVTHPWRTIGLLCALPTLWAVLVALLLPNPDAAFEPMGLASLYIGWQVIFIGTLVLARRG